MKLKGLLLDSGDALVRPKGGAWWPGAHFRRIIEEHGLAHLASQGLDRALSEGMEYLDANHSVANEAEERAQFTTYYEMVLRALGLADPPAELTRALGDAAVDEVEIEPFPDTHAALERLRGGGLALGVLSNAWPSLERKYRQLGLRDFFDVFVVSSKVGCVKPDERMFRAGLEGLKMPPEAVAFADDCAQYVRKAAEMGMRGIVVSRGAGEDTGDDLECVEDLAQLADLLCPTAFTRSLGTRPRR